MSDRIYRIGELTKDRPYWIGKIQVAAVEGVGIPGPCWIWRGCRDKKTGYGRITVDKRTGLYIHRFVYETLVGPIPPGLTIDHLCRQRECCAPHHLEPVTCLENVRRSPRAQKTHCPQGHPYDGENLRTYIDSAGRVRRKCRTCNRERCAEWRSERQVSA